jgi:hypothetical protein
MTALAVSSDVEGVLGRTLTTEEAAKVDAALAKASAWVRAETGRFFEAGTYTVRRKTRNRRVVLDDPVSVASVEVVDSDGTATAVTGWVLRGSVLYGLGCEGWVEVEYASAGTVPEPLVGVVAAMAARNLTASAPEGAESYTVTRGPFTESASFGESTDSVATTPSEAAIVRRYALRRSGSVSLL